MPPLLQRLSERKPEALDYLGVSYGLTSSLLRCVLLLICPATLRSEKMHLNRFWKRARYTPLYVRQTTSELTGEHTCVMVRGLNSSNERDLEWLGEFAKGTTLFLGSGARGNTDDFSHYRFPKKVPFLTVIQI